MISLENGFFIGRQPTQLIGREDETAAIKEQLLRDDVRQQQLAEALSEISHRGDREWTRRLRAEVDEASRLLQAPRAQREQIAGPITRTTCRQDAAGGAQKEAG